MSDTLVFAADSQKRSSSFRATLIAFLLLNFSLQAIMFVPGINPYVFLFLVQNQNVMPEIVNYKGSTIAFLGSSVIEIPLCLLDSSPTYSAQIENTEKLLASALSDSDLKCRLLSIEGGLLSDQYLVLQHLASAKIRPRLAVLTLVPRDFYDTRFKKCGQTAGFRALSGFSNFHEWSKYLDNMVEYCDAILDKGIWLYRFRTLIAIELKKQVMPYFLPLCTQLGRVAIAPAETMQREFTRKTDRALMKHSLQEYEKVYEGISKSKEYRRQIDFLRNSLAFATQSKLRLLLVNLPISKENQDLLPDGFYEQYRSQIAEIADSAGIDFVDFNKPELFTLSDFWDSGHLGLSGAKKFVTYLVGPISMRLSPRDRAAVHQD